MGGGQPGMGGPSWHQMRSTLYDQPGPKILGFYAGIGGKEVKVDDIVKIGEKTLKAAKGQKVEPLVEWV